MPNTWESCTLSVTYLVNRLAHTSCQSRRSYSVLLSSCQVTATYVDILSQR
ncbi:hypothetical protein F383_36739 [Gossypium arboreum]|uniref:Uncharacterized protein n=1 Tax=Gossypium arboreum TaxID=29729 RepID=A0A0B0MDM3_GOSAR|nr:hypothetical protein F383_36739 [Gossypium arboreum]